MTTKRRAIIVALVAFAALVVGFSAMAWYLIAIPILTEDRVVGTEYHISDAQCDEWTMSESGESKRRCVLDRGLFVFTFWEIRYNQSRIVQNRPIGHFCKSYGIWLLATSIGGIALFLAIATRARLRRAAENSRTALADD